jgi:predicted metalloprotease with PDZ domain
VTRDSAAARSGIAPGDELIGVGGTRVEGTGVEATLRGRAPGDAVEVLLARDGRILSRTVKVDPPRLDVVKLVAARNASPAARAAFEAWLGAPHPAWTIVAATAP